MHGVIIDLSELKKLSQDDELMILIDKWNDDINTKKDNHLYVCIMKTVIYVAERLLAQKAMLLPDICSVFLEYYSNENHSSESIETDECMTKFSARWLLNQLIYYLKHHLCHKCVHRKFGTVVYRTGGDIIGALSWALGDRTTCSCTNQNPNITRGGDSLAEAAYILNDIIHREIKRLKSIDCDPINFNIDDAIANVDERLVQFIERTTTSVHARAGVAAKSEESIRKKLRRFFIIDQLIFCTNPSSVSQLHLLLADTIEICGGSRELIKILNRLGCVVSNDRYITHMAESHRDASIWEALDSSKFTVSKVDNFDKQSRHALVRSTADSRSYHGTTVMIVQPDKSQPSGEYTPQGIRSRHAYPDSEVGPASNHTG